VADRTNFSNEEWNLLWEAPVLAPGRVSVSDPSDLIVSLKEAYGGMKSMLEAYEQSHQLEMIDALLFDENSHRRRPSSAERPISTNGGQLASRGFRKRLS
jgi:hypothetical protein